MNVKLMNWERRKIAERCAAGELRKVIAFDFDIHEVTVGKVARAMGVKRRRIVSPPAPVVIAPELAPEAA